MFEFITEAEKQQLLVDFNDTKVDYPKDKTIIDLFEEQVDKTPDNIAVVFEEIQLTYKELNEKANQLAHYLRETYKIQADDLIGIKLERSERMILAILGILKSGAAYVPIDPSYPQERIAYIEKDSNCKIVIDEQALEIFHKIQDKYTKSNILKINKPKDLAYVIYTSGTTGNPKGVMVENSSLINRLEWMQKAYALSDQDVILQKTSYSFDVSVWELFWWIYKGSQVCMLKPEGQKNPKDLIDCIEKYKVSVLHFVPSMLSLFLDFLKENELENERLKSLKQIFVSGEALSVNQNDKFFAQFTDVSLMNLYGPTEVTIDVSYYNCSKGDTLIPIGKPIDNTQIYILDEGLQPVSIGIRGKLYISGDGVARGYLNKPELTAEKFILNPFIKGTRMYDTGDLGRWLPDGNIEFLGRNDHQVKIRGYRIELGEIETAISQYSEDIQQIVVEAKEINQDKTLVAYYVSKTEIDKSELRTYLQNKLPEYMVPGFYVEIESLPLTPNGKIDRKALPSVTGEDIIKKDYVAPGNAIEEKMVEIWQEVLGVQKIGITDNFFELGGHSLIVVQVINQIFKQLGKTISFKIFFANPTIKALSKQLKQSEYLRIPKAAEDESYPLTASQSRLWILSQLEGGSLAYNMPAAVRFTGTVDYDKFEEAFRLLIKRHEILRTSFKVDKQGEVRQWIVPIEKVDFIVVQKDFSKQKKNQEQIVANYLQELNSIAFDLEHTPVRASMIKLKEKEHVFFLSLHHIIGDGWSIELLISEVEKIYNSLVEGKEAQLPVLSIQYKDYAVWQNSEGQKQKQQVSEVYWLEQFEGELPVINLPSFKARPLVKTYNGDTISYQFSKEFLNKLKDFSKKQDVTLFMTLMAGVNALLHRYTSQDDIIIGTPIAGREHPDLENQLGLYLNTVAIRTQFRENESFQDLVQQEKETLLGAYEHQGYPFDELVGKLNTKRDASRNALFDVMVVLQNQGQLNNINNKEELNNISISNYDFESTTSQFDINFKFFEQEVLNLSIEYNTDIYDLELINRVFSHFENLITPLLEQPEMLINEIDYITQEEKHQLLVEFNNTQVDYPKDKTIIDLFEEQVKKTPNNVAVVFEDTELTYNELNEKANQLARYLILNGVKAQDNVALIATRGFNMIIGLYGILKTGAAYVPIDNEYPSSRKQYMVSNSNVKFIIQEEILSSENIFGEISLIFMNDIFIKNESVNNLNLKINIDSLAYTIYTSGSTGNPKGVMIRHFSVVNLIDWVNSRFRVTEKDRLLFITSMCFDLSVYDVFGILSAGGALVIANEKEIRDSGKLIDLLLKEKITFWDSVPSTMNLLVDIIESEKENYIQNNLRVIFMSGDWIPVQLPERINKYFPSAEIISLGGATEGTVWSIYYPILNVEKNWTRIPYGKPIQNNTFYILDKYQKPVPYGVQGYLYIGGIGVATGYANDNLKTEAAFLEDPFYSKFGGIMYNTGDIGYMGKTNNIEFLGRLDHQVKVRGFRIELGEIETAISEYSEEIQQVVVEAKEINQDKTLVAYYVSKTEIDKSEIRAYLQNKLPEYMVPGFYVEIESLPLTPNGKIDRKALPDVTGEDIIKKDYVAPRNKEEQLIVDVWTSVLKQEAISVKDSFYNLGGDSIKSIQVASRLKQKGYTVKIDSILRNPVVEDLAKLVQLDTAIISQDIIKGPVVLTPIQKRFFEDGTIINKNYYNQSILLKSKLPINDLLLKEALSILVKHHDALRMSYELAEDGWQQYNLDDAKDCFKISFFDLRESKNPKEELNRLGEDLQSGFNLGSGVLFHIGHFRTDNGDQLALIIHHLVIDGVSWRILLEDFSTIYQALETNSDFQLPLKTDSFQKWASLQQSYAKSAVQQQERTYWENLSQTTVALLPKDFEDLDNKAIINESSSFVLDIELTQKLQTQVHNLYSTEINDVLLTALALGIKETFGVEKSVVQMEGHGREEIIDGVDISRTIGWFTNIYPFVLDISENQHPEIVSVKESLRKVPNKGIGYGILKYLDTPFEKELVPSIQFNYLGDFGSNADGKEDSQFEFSGESIGASKDPANVGSDVLLDVSGMMVSGQLSMSIGYSGSLFKQETIEKLVSSYHEHLCILIKELSQRKENRLTPSDLTFKGLSIEDLFRINNDNAIEDIYELSPLQQGMYYHWLSEKSSSMYFEQMSYRIKALDLDIQSVHESYDKLISRHSVLRTSFIYDLSDHPLQIVRKVVPSQFSYQAVPQETDVNDYVEEVKLKDREKGFDLETSFSQMRLQVLDIGDDQYEFIWSHHHILTDGWCMSILINDFYQILNSIDLKIPLNLPKPLPYANYIQWLNKINTNDSMEYWKGYLRNYSQVAEIPFKTLSTENPIYKESKEFLKIEGDLYQRLNSICSQIGVTQNTFMQSIWGYLLSRYNSTQDVVFGAVVSGRPAELTGVENMVGLFINTIPVRVRYNAGDTALDLLTQVHNEAISGNAHHYLNLSEVQSQSELGMNLINNIMLFDNYPVQEIIKENVENTQSQKGQELTIESMEVFGQTNYDFSFMVSPRPLSLIVELRYNANKFEPQLIKKMINHIDNLVEQFSVNIDKPLNTLNYLTQEEKQQLLVDFNDSKVDYPKDKTIIDLFEEQVDKTPDNIAVVFEEVQLTYKQLNEKANQLAHYLRETYKIQADDLIGIKLERSEQMILAILGILKSGAAYVPIDPSYPQARIAYIEKDSNCKIVIDEEVMILFDFERFRYTNKNLNHIHQLDNLAYIIYTSGTTGNPKGVMVEHKNLVNSTICRVEFYQFKKILLTSSIAFDPSIAAIWGVLLNGGSLIVENEYTIKDSENIVKRIIKIGITDILCVPSYYIFLFNELQKYKDVLKLKNLILGGEQIKLDLITSHKEHFDNIALYNEYGPTECTVWTTVFNINDCSSLIPIGSPISNTQVYILDESLQPLPIGVAGKLYVSGAGVARGYLNKPELTAEKFISNPFIKGTRMYDTGDLGRWLPDGNIEFLGRNDHQVKIRGYRIELGEIETAISGYSEEIQQVVVEAKEINQDKTLVAYYVSKTEIDKSEIRTYLQNKLPEYMVPGFYVEIESLPLTPNGKIDRKALPSVTGEDIIKKDYVAPRNKEEQLIVDVWTSVLKQEAISVKDSFYNLGGDSIKSIQVASRLRQKGYTVKIDSILRNPIVEDLAKLVQLDTAAISQDIIKGPVVLTPIQKLFFEDGTIINKNYYNQSILLKSKLPINDLLLKEALSILVKHHDALRMSYELAEDGWQQYNLDDAKDCFKISFFDLRESKNPKEELNRLGEDLQSGFNLGSGVLFHIGHFRTDNGDQLALIIHHLVVDGVSWRILLEDFSTIYQALETNSEVQLPLKTDSFQKWASLQQSYAKSAVQQQERTYWENLSQTTVALLPKDFEDLGNKAINKKSLSFALDMELTKKLQTKVHHLYNTEINDVLLTALALGIKETFGVEKSVVQMEGHGREEIIDGVDISRTIGWFTSVYPFVLDISENQHPEIVSVKESLRKVPNKGIGYGILKYLDAPFQKELVPSIQFNYLGDFGSNADGKEDSQFEFSGESIGASKDPANVGSDVLLDVSGMMVSGQLSMSIGYSGSLFKQETIEKLVSSYHEHLCILIKELSQSKENRLTPSDLTFKGLSIEDLFRINNDNAIEDIYELSPLQQGLYYHWLVEESSSLYFMQTCYTLRAENLNINNVREAYQELVNRYDILRTSFSNDHNARLQIVHKEALVDFNHKILNKDETDPVFLAKIKQEDISRGFDLNKPTQMRLQVLDLGYDNYEFIWSHHHIVMDGWCMSILINDFSSILNDLDKKQPISLEKPAKYANYIKWLSKVDKQTSLAYWKRYLDGFETATELTFKNRKRTQGQNANFKSESIYLEEELFEKIKDTCNDFGITKNTFIQGVWGYLLSRYNNSKDVVFGSVVSGRPADLVGVENMVGLFSNTIPVRLKYDESATVKDFLQKLHAEAIESSDFHYVSLAEVQSQSSLGMELINNLVIFENYAVADTLETDNKINIENINVFDELNYGFAITVKPSESCLEIEFRFDSNIFDIESIGKMKAHFEAITHSFVSKSQTAIHLVDYLTQGEKQQLLVDFNHSKVDYPKDKTIIGLFEEQVDKTPDNIAVVFEGVELTYKQLNEKANQLAHYLRETYKIQADDLIGIKLERSEQMILAILGILKSGAAYVPIDPGYPEERIAYIEKDSNCKIVIDGEVMMLFDFERFRYTNKNLNQIHQLDNLAYVIYTSGTTGNPKGVMVEHSGILNTILAQIELFDLQKIKNSLQFASLSFDASISEIFISLLSGSCLFVVEEKVRKDVKLFENFIQENQIEIGTLPPAYLKLLDIETLKGFKCLITAGESADFDKVREYSNYGTFYNAYGPTETSICASIFKIEKGDNPDSSNISIGSPISNTQVYILDESLQPLPIGVAGKLYVSGAGVARGYLNKPELTAEKFISNPFIKGTRMYDTGDLGRWLPDGNIEFLGRNDNQVKIRGYRIELGEIETAISEYSEEIQQVVVEAKEINQDKTLVAYYVSKTEIDKSEIRAYLQNKLPEYMVPGFYVEIESLPLTPNGKIDRKALPSVTGEDIIKKEYVAPRNAIEEKMVEIWQEVLGVQKIGITDNFFELGGHSLIVVQVINQISKQLGQTISFKIFFANPTIKELSKELKQSEYLDIPKAAEDESYPLTSSQSRLWILSQLEGGSLAYNMPAAVRFTGTVDFDKFEESFRLLIKRHEILRTYFKTNEQGDIRQYILPIEQVEFRITLEDYRSVENQEETVVYYLEKRNDEPFDLEHGPLVRASLIHLNEQEYVFFLSMHHIIGDGWSMELLISEIVKTYNALMQGEAITLPELRIQYKDYAVWLNTTIQQEKHQVSEQYWLEQFGGELPVLDLPSFKTRPLVQTYNGDSFTHTFSKEFLDKLKTFSKEQEVTLFMTLMAGINVLLYRYTGQDDIIIGTPIAGREHPDLENQIGIYLNTLAIRTQLKEGASFLDLVAIQKETLLGAYEHQGYPFDALVGKLNLNRDVSRSALFDVLVVLQNQGQLNNLNTEELIDFEVSGFNFSRKVSKFDISFAFFEAEGLGLTIEYNTDIYDGYLIERMFSHFENLVRESIEQPETLIQELNYLTQEEKQQLLLDFNDTEVAYPQDKTIVDLFEEQVVKTPNNVAVVFEEKELTYQELNEKANQLMYYLQKQGVGLDSKIVLCFDSFIDLQIVGLLGIIKSGAVYVPIEPDYPQERIQHILDDTKARFVLTSSNHSDIFATTDDNILFLDQLNFNEEIQGNKIRLKQNDICNIIYTSGSTGNPKGVLVSHGNLMDYLFGLSSKIKIEENRSFAMMSTVSTDSGSTVLFGSLIFGKTIHMFSKNSLRDINYIQQYFRDNKIDCIKIVPPYWASLNEHDMMPTPNKMIIFGGEELTNEIVETAIKKDPNVVIINHYGPTEATIGKLLHVVESTQKGRSIPIGRAFSNTQLYILDKNLKICPIGVKGELFIGGDGVAKGYLNNSTLTQEKFVENCIDKNQGKLYKTGDLVVMRPDGNIEFIGRMDNQVKIFGHRIELNEIDRAINQFPLVKASVALVKSNANHHKNIVSYIVTDKTIDKSELRSFLQGKLPPYMIPGFYVEIESIPLTPMGKINRKALPDVTEEDIVRKEYIGPRSKEEKLLVSVWEDVLKRESISIKDNFYNLGGDSIKSIQIVSRLKQRGYTLKIQQILQVPVLEDLTKYLEVNSQIADQSTVSGEVDFTPIQYHFFENPIFKVHHHYNQSVLLKSKEELNQEFLSKSIEFLIKHHDVLRMVYSNSGGNWKQFNQGISTNDVSIMFHDLREEQDELEVMFNLGEKLQSSFNLMEGPLFKVGHFRLKDGDRLALIVHHLVVDGVSWRILLEDLSTLYGQYRFGEKPKLPLKTDSFKLWASLQKEYAYGDKIKLEKTYWEDICNQLIPVFPKDMELSESTIIRKDGSISFILNKSITELLQTQVHGVYNTEINDVLLTGLGLAIKETFGINKSVVKMEGHGREDIIADVDISRTVGWFTSVYPFVLNLADSKPAIANLIGVKEDLRKIPNKGIGYGILKYLSDGFSKGLEPSIEFNYLGDFGNNVTNKSNSLFEYSSESIGLDIDRQNESDVALSVSGILVSGQLRMSINFSKEIYQLNTIQDLVDSYQRNLTNIIEELSIIKENYPTPSDLTFKGLSIEDLFVINRDNTLEDVYKLSPLQQGMYYHWLSEKSSSMYFEQMSYRIKALDLDIQSVHESYDKLISRHSVLRTSFNYDLSDHPLQIVRKVVPSQFSYQAVSQETDVNDYVEEVKLKDREKGFDLETSFSQMRLQVLNIGDDQYEFIWSRHHILTDGWCMSILINDFYQILNSVSQKEPLNLPKPLPYANYIQWLDKVNTNDSMEYWKGYLRNYSQVAEIPFKTLSTENPIYKESKEILKIEGDLYQRLNSICSQIGVTQNTFMQSIWGYLLSRYNSTQDVVFGAVVSGRPGDLDGVENMIGLFINTIPVRVRYNAGDTALDLLTQVQNEAISGNAHHYLNLSEVQSQSELGMNLINHIMVFENYPVQEIIKENVENTQSQKGQELTIESMEVFEQTNYDFSIMVIPTPLSLIVELRYNANKFEPQLIKGIVNHIGNLVEQFSINIDKPLNTLNYLTQGEKQQLLVDFNDTKVDYPKDKTIIDLFEEQVDKTPDNIAVVFEEVQLTYKELNEKANQLAHYLRETYKIQADDLIGMKLERSEQMILAILGILKSGAAYVPIDPSYPQERIAYIEKDSNCKIVIDNQEIKKFSEIRDDYSRENLSSIVCADDLVYIIYTSGSTGTPKGIMMHHKSMSNLVSFHTNVINENFGKVLQFTSISFDVSFQEIFTTLTRGTTIYPISESSKSNPIEIVDFINVNYIDTIFLPTSYFKVLIETKEFNHLIRQNNFLKNIIVAGEQLTLSNDAIKIIKESKIKLHNHYGPAETHVVTTIVLEENYLNNNPSIGKPIDNTQIYILDEGLQPVSIGVTGKLYISGAGVSRGYLNKPELTAEKFISNPFIKGTRMYDTGDLAKWLPDGNIEFLGRNDHQVKIRGYRIELGEIETAISGYSEEIQQIVVEAKEINQDKALVAYYVSKIEIDKSDIRTYLQNKLPQYMVPSFYVEIESLPLTPNGKIDRKALPSVTGEDIIKKEYVAPRNAIEEKMVEIWQEVLGVQKIGITDNFFELGGNSISALRMISKFQLKFGTKLPVTLLFKNPNISLIKQKMDSNNSIPYSNSLLIPINEKGTKTPIFFAPPAGGGNLTYKDLSEAIGDHQPTYGLNVRGLDGELPPHETVEEIAACYIEEIQKVDPHGPYILGGFSSGGRIAFEMAFQLFRKGFEVKKLLLFDSMAPDVDYSTFHPQTYPEWLIRIAEVISELFLLKDKVRLAINELENLNKEEQFSLFYKKLTDLGLDMKKNYLRGYVDVYIKTVTMTYAPPIDEKLNCPIILFKCIKKIDRSNYTIKMKEALANIDEKEIGWQKCTNNVVTVHELECAHNEVMNSPHVKTIAINLVKHLS